MKTKDQVIRQLKELKFADDEWNKTLKFLNSVGIKPKRATKSGAISCSFDDFMDWYQHGYGSGDIIGYGRTAIVVSFCFQDSLIYCGYFGLDKELLPVEQSFASGDITRCNRLKNEELIEFQTNYLGSEYVTNVAKGVLERKPIPMLGRVYEFLNGGQKFIGYVSGVSDEKVTFCYQYNQDSLELNVLSVSPCQVFGLVSNTAKLYKEIQDRFGYSWDSKTCQFVLLPQRSRKGGVYFYITDRFTVSAAKDGYTMKSDMQYSSGNYFASKIEAEEFLNIILEARKKQLKASTTFTGS